jgi:hypothetical protein
MTLYQNDNWPSFSPINGTINKNHAWYFQIQGQLWICKRSRCILAIFASEDVPLHTVVVEKDAAFWYTKMESQLKSFYLNCILPELIDPRHTRNMAIRNPTY